MNEIERTTQRLANASKTIVDKAAELQAVAEQLRADVDALTARVTAAESRADDVAGNLVISDERVEGQQVVQNERLDTLETNGN